MKLTTLMAFLILQLTIISGQDKEALIKDLEQNLMAPCCWSGTVADHGHPEMEEQIRELVDDGKSRDEIMSYFVGIYGERILASPVARGFNLMAWIAPTIVFLLGVLVFVNYQKHRSREPLVATPLKESGKIPYDDIIEKELKEMD